jgi:hypothetical protein
LDRIQVYGFDYDYTLAHYTEELQSLIYKLAKEHLVHEVSCLARSSLRNPAVLFFISILTQRQAVTHFVVVHVIIPIF